MPFAPPWFSTMNGWPSCCWSCAAISLAQVTAEIGEIGDALPVAAEDREVGDVEAHERRKEPPIRFRDLPTGEIGLAAKPCLELVERREELVVRLVVGFLRAREAAA